MAWARWSLLAATLLASAPVLAAGKDSVPPDKEMLQMMDLLRDIELIKQMDLLRDMKSVEYAGKELDGRSAQKSLPPNKKEAAK